MIEYLVDHGYSYEDAVWGVDHLVEEYHINWAEQAAWFANYYATFGPVSRSRSSAQ